MLATDCNCVLSPVYYGDKKQSIFNLSLIKNVAAETQFKLWTDPKGRRQCQ